MFLINILIITINILIIITNKFNIFTVADLNYSIKLININLIIFMFYIYSICITYILSYIISIIITKLKKHKNINTTNNKLSLTINNVDCSCILDFNNKEEIIKNYNILIKDINAKLTNGYTIYEYTKIKNIMNKLNINDSSNINLNINELNKISNDDYNLLKKYIKSQKELNKIKE